MGTQKNGLFLMGRLGTSSFRVGFAVFRMCNWTSKSTVGILAAVLGEGFELYGVAFMHTWRFHQGCRVWR